MSEKKVKQQKKEVKEVKKVIATAEISEQELQMKTQQLFQKKMSRVQKEINAALNKEGLAMVPALTILSTGQIYGEVRFVPMKKNA